MPVNKNAYRRYQLIDEILRKEDKCQNFMEIQWYLTRHHCKISDSQLENDLKAMRNQFKCSIKYDRDLKGYYYADPQVFFDVPIGNADLETILMAMETLRQFRNSAAFKNVSKSLDRMMSRLEMEFDETQEHLAKVIYYEPEPYFAGSEWLSVIYDAIREERIISFTFNQSGSDADHVLNPYFLKEFAGRWYVIGLEADEIVTFGLDRIKKLIKTDHHFERNQEQAVQIKVNIELNLGILDFKVRTHDVHIRFDASLADEIKSNPFLAKQKIIHEDSKDIIVSLDVIINEAFVRKVVFPYGDKATVCNPPFAVDAVVRTLTRMLDLHKSYASKNEHESS